ncbi:hypothetical protein QLX08_000403 [Tetragonisca angustula]|uniref:Uncharacterized protein n=1 Tax=Tetragonisca angustula TaxID=166442 RepID=A0AAW1AJV7_9HYME
MIKLEVEKKKDEELHDDDDDDGGGGGGGDDDDDDDDGDDDDEEKEKDEEGETEGKRPRSARGGSRRAVLDSSPRAVGMSMSGSRRGPLSRTPAT